MFKKKFEQLCAERNLSPCSVCEAVGISKSNYSNWDDSSKPRKTTILKIAKYLNVSPDEFETKNPPNIYDVDRLISFEEIGTICAGFNGSINEVPTGEIVELPASMISSGYKDNYFVLRVKGNSMYPRLLENDRILCKRCPSVDSGDYAVVLFDGDCATVKKVNYVQGEDWLELVPINPDYEVKRIQGADLEQCRILGKVVKLIRDF